MQAVKERIQVSHFINADRPEVWQAWTNPEIMSKWFCPEDLTPAGVQSDFRVGGQYRAIMVKQDNQVLVCKGTYKEILPNKKLVFTHSWEGQSGPDTVVTVELETMMANGTLVKLTQEGFEDHDEAKSHSEGWSSALKNLSKQFL